MTSHLSMSNAPTETESTARAVEASPLSQALRTPATEWPEAQTQAGSSPPPLGRVNRAGAHVSERGFILCRQCGKEEQGISKEVSIEYAFCIAHQRQSHHKEKGDEIMTEKKVTKTKAKATKKPSTKAKGSASSNVPQTGKVAEVIAIVKEHGGMTRDEILKQAVKVGLKRTHVVRYCKKLGLLKVEKTEKAKTEKSAA